MSSAHVISHHLRSERKKAEEAAVAAGVEFVPRARIMYVTSNVEQEGKSTCVARLGVNLAKDGWRTLLIDCDLRNPSLAPLFFDKEDENRPKRDAHSINAIVSGAVEPADDFD